MSNSETFAIAELIASRCRELGLSRYDLICRTGYANIGKGLRRLDQLLSGDVGRAAHLVSALPYALALPSGVVLGSVAETKRQLARLAGAAREKREAAWRTTFRPHTVILAERAIPQPIFIAALIGVERLLRVELDQRLGPDTFVDQSIKGIRERLREFCPRRCNDCDFLPAFGRLAGFIINYTPDQAVRYNRRGEAQEVLPRAHQIGEAWIDFKGGGRLTPICDDHRFNPV